MKTGKSILGLLMCLLSATIFAAPTLKGNRILVFSKTVKFRHSSIAAGKQMFLDMQQSERVAIDTTEDASVFFQLLPKADVVVLMNTTGDIFDEGQQEVFKNFVERGGKVLGIHSATDTEYDWPWYNFFIGGYFESHPKPQTASFTVTEAKHPAVLHWPHQFNRFEELYNFKSLQTNELEVVLTVDESTYEGGKMGAIHPMAWYHEVGKGKVFYTALGHHPETYRDKDFVEHIKGALIWLAEK